MKNNVVSLLGVKDLFKILKVKLSKGVSFKIRFLAVVIFMSVGIFYFFFSDIFDIFNGFGEMVVFLLNNSIVVVSLRLFGMKRLFV